MKASYLLPITLVILLLSGVTLAARLILPALTTQVVPCAPGFHIVPTAPLQAVELPYTTQARSVALNSITGVLYALDNNGILHIWQNGVETACQNKLPVGELILNPGNNQLYLSSYTETLVLDGETGSVIYRIPLSGTIAVSPLNHRILILQGHDVFLFDTRTYEIIGTVPGLYIDRPDTKAYTDRVYGDEVTDRYPRAVITIPGSRDYWIVTNDTDLGHGGMWGKPVVEALDPVSFAVKWRGDLWKLDRIAVNPFTGEIYYMDHGQGDDPVSVLRLYDSHYHEQASILHSEGPLVLDAEAQRLYVIGGYVTVVDANTFEIVDRFSHQSIIAAARGYLLIHSPSSLRLAQAETVAGEQHSQVQSIESIHSFDQIQQIDGTLFLTAVSHLYRSVDQGTTWQQVIACHSTNPTRLVISPSKTLFFTCSSSNPHHGEGIFRSEDLGQTWMSANRGLSQLNFNTIVLSPNYSQDHTLWAQAFNYDNPWRVSYDDGNHWQPSEQPVLPNIAPMSIRDCTGHEIRIREQLQYQFVSPSAASPMLTDAGWAVGEDHLLYHYNDAQACWNQDLHFEALESAPYFLQMVDSPLSLAAVNAQEAYVVTHEVAMDEVTKLPSIPTQLTTIAYRTSDGGNNWTEVLRATNR